jgi:hypothetical protein
MAVRESNTMKVQVDFTAMKAEAQNYVVGMTTKHGITKLKTGKSYTQEDAIARAFQMNETCQLEMKALGGISFVAISASD